MKDCYKGMDIAYAMKKKGKKMSEGEKPMPEAHEKTNAPALKEDDLVSRIMNQQKHMYAHGGDVEADKAEQADNSSADFDYLDEIAEPINHNSGADEGDDDGDEYDASHEDLVGRIMMKKFKQRNPSPA